IRFDPAWLVCSRPDRAAVSVAKENVGSPGITRAVLPPSGDCKISPTAVSRTRCRHHHYVSPVGEEMGARSRVVCGGEAPEDRWDEIADVRDRLYFLDPGPGDQDVARSAFLQQQLSGQHARLGMKARTHDAL